jgi:hypothetical protein
MVAKGAFERTMTQSKSKGADRRRRPTGTISIRLSLDEVLTLIQLSSYYGRMLGAVRRIIQMVSPGEMRAKSKFVQEEAYWLRRFAEAQRDRMKSQGETESVIDFTPKALVAFYGRTLASLNVPRTRRRLSPEKIEAREALAEKLRSALVNRRSDNQALVDAEVQTRRLREREWIVEKLTGSVQSADA